MSALAVARGDCFLDENAEGVLSSPLPNIASDEEWTQFVDAMIVAEPSDVSPSNALGMFAMMPRRLDDLGLLVGLKRKKSKGRTIWVGAFRPPLTCAKFLGSPRLQYRAFCVSMKDYAHRLTGKMIERGSMSLSGALAVLHRAGPKGLACSERFPATQEAYDRAAGIF